MSGGINDQSEIVHAHFKLVQSGVSEKQANIDIGKRYKLKPQSIQTYVSRARLYGTYGAELDPKAPVATSRVEEVSALASAIHTKLKKQKLSVEQLADIFDIAPKEVRHAIDSLKKTHVLICESQSGEISCDTEMQPNSKPDYIDFTKHGEVEIPIGVLADTHLCSKYERLDVLNALYDRYESYGITDVYHGGNWIDGEARFNKFDIDVHGIGGQIGYFLKHYPQRKGITTHLISGDDHEGWYVQREGINIGQTMEDSAVRSGRNDLKDLGYMERDINLQREDGSAIMRVIHAGGGSAYAISYTSQKYVEALQGGEKPKIVIVGHFHKFDWAYPREVHVIQPGCTQDQTPFMRKKRLQAMIGGCVLWVKQARNGVITSLKVEWIPFYDKKFYAYHW